MGPASLGILSASHRNVASREHQGSRRVYLLGPSASRDAMHPAGNRLLTKLQTIPIWFWELYTARQGACYSPSGKATLDGDALFTRAVRFSGLPGRVTLGTEPDGWIVVSACSNQYITSVQDKGCTDSAHPPARLLCMHACCECRGSSM